MIAIIKECYNKFSNIFSLLDYYLKLALVNCLRYPRLILYLVIAKFDILIFCCAI